MSLAVCRRLLLHNEESSSQEAVIAEKGDLGKTAMIGDSLSPKPVPQARNTVACLPLPQVASRGSVL